MNYYSFHWVRKFDYQKPISVLLTVLLIFQIISGVFFFASLPKQVQAATQTRSFTPASNYTYDNTKIEISSDQTQHKATSMPNWYDNDWSYRRAITIDNTGNANYLTNYQIKIQLTTSNFDYHNASSTGADIRFTDTNGTTIIDFWIEEWDNTATSTIWVEVPSIPASSIKTIYMYYGNPRAIGTSNGDNTFEFFDTFDESIATDSYSRFETGEVKPVFTGGGVGAWDETVREKVSVIEDDGIYKMWYVGHDSTGPRTSKIGYATSTDGVTWTRYSGNPIIDRSSQDQDISVVKISDTSYYMYIERDDNYIDLFTSSDGISWTAYGSNPVKSTAASPVVWKENSNWYMLYEDMTGPVYNINLATSTNGKSWTDSPSNPVLSESDHTVPDSIVKVGSTYHLYYHRSEGGTWPAWHAISTNLTTWSNREKILDGFSSQFTFVTNGGQIWSYVWYVRGDRNYYLRYGKDSLGTKWNIYPNLEGSYFLHDNLLDLTGHQVLSKTYQITNGIIEAKVKIIAGEGSMFARAAGNTGDQFTNSSYGYHSGDFGAGNTWNLAITQNGVKQFSDTTQAFLNQWLLQRFTLNGDYLEIKRFRYSDMSPNGAPVSGTLTTYTSGYIGISTYSVSRRAQFDWILVRQYTSPEPSTSIGLEEELGEELEDIEFDLYVTDNPFQYGTTTYFIYDLPKDAYVTIKIFNLAGDLIRHLIDNVYRYKAKNIRDAWDGRNDSGDFVGSGIYIYYFKAEYDDGTTKTITKPIGVIK